MFFYGLYGLKKEIIYITCRRQEIIINNIKKIEPYKNSKT